MTWEKLKDRTAKGTLDTKLRNAANTQLKCSASTVESVSSRTCAKAKACVSSRVRRTMEYLDERRPDGTAARSSTRANVSRRISTREDIWTIFVGYNLEARGVDLLEEVCGAQFPGAFEHLTGTREESRKVLDADITRLHPSSRCTSPRMRSWTTCASASCWTWRSTWGSTHSGSNKSPRHRAPRLVDRREGALQVEVGTTGGRRRGRQVRPLRASRNMLLTGQDYTK
jgi:hypothetical protein